MARKTEIWCPIRGVLEIIEGKWTAHIITELFSGTKRHSQLSRSLKGINPKTLTDKLRALEQAGIVQRKMFEEIPPRVEYSLSQRGRELSQVFAVINELGEQWQSGSSQPCPHCQEDAPFKHSKNKAAPGGNTVDRKSKAPDLKTSRQKK